MITIITTYEHNAPNLNLNWQNHTTMNQKKFESNISDKWKNLLETWS